MHPRRSAAPHASRMCGRLRPIPRQVRRLRVVASKGLPAAAAASGGGGGDDDDERDCLPPAGYDGARGAALALRSSNRR
eukprot:1613487-Prymnesium_polylepis.1